MITIKNISNQPLMVGGKSLPVGGELKFREADAEINRLAARRFVTVIEPVPAKEPDKTPETNTNKGDKK